MADPGGSKRYCTRCKKDVTTNRKGHCPDCSLYLPKPKG